MRPRITAVNTHLREQVSAFMMETILVWWSSQDARSLDVRQGDMAELESQRFFRWQGRDAAWAAFVLIPVLAGCHDNYPSLSSVPEEARPSLPIEARREIVRDLIAEREESQQQTAVVRKRSGLSTETLPAEDSDIDVEDVIPDAPESADDAFSLAPDDEDRLSPVFRRDVDGDDGGLNDFIRQLQRDTSPPAPEPEIPADGSPAEVGDDDVSFFRPGSLGDDLTLATSPDIRLAAFAPGLGRQGAMPEVGAIRFVAEHEPGVFCRFFGWTVALFGVCEDDTETASAPDSEEDVRADLEEEARRLQEEKGADDQPSAGGTSSDEPEQEPSANRQLVEDAADAIEDAGKGALAPVSNSLEKLRDYIRARRSVDEPGSARERPRSSHDVTETRQAAVVDRPPMPRERPERREDITIVDRNERFDFNRTPLPAFKPTPDLPVILPPAETRPPSRQMDGRQQSPRLSPVRPSDLAADRKENAPTMAADGKDSEAQGNVPITLAERAGTARDDGAKLEAFEEAAVPPSVALMEKLESLDAASSPPVERPDMSRPTETEPLLVFFESGKPGLPEDMVPELITLLVDAVARDKKIYIYGEASSNHLARRRATEVGAALVQLGATAEILEYDHRTSLGVDQARLVLRPAKLVEQSTKAKPTAIQ